MTSVPSQHDPALQPLDQLVAVGGVAVGRHVPGADLALALALGHRLEPSRSREQVARGRSATASTRVHARDAHRDRIAERSVAPRALAVQDRALLVELPPLARLLLLDPAAAAPAPRRRRHLLRAGARGRCPSSRTGSIPSNGRREHRAGRAGRAIASRGRGGDANATNAPAEIRPVTSPRERAARAHPRTAARSSAKQRAMSSRVALDRHRLALAFGGPRAELGQLAGARRGLARPRRRRAARGGRRGRGSGGSAR